MTRATIRTQEGTTKHTDEVGQERCVLDPHEDFPPSSSLARGTQPDVSAEAMAASRSVAAERSRDSYITTIAHDLQSPLSLLALDARLLASRIDPADEDAGSSVQRILHSAAFMERMIRDLVDLAAVEAGRLELQREPACLAALATGAVDRSVATRDRPRVQLEVCGTAAANIDAMRIERVLANLLHNAIKFSPPDAPIVVRVETRRGVVRVSVIDRGPGLTPDEAVLAFDDYCRARAVDRHDGVGLGLYISRRIVEAHGGRIEVESIPGAGATFFMEFPIYRAETARRPGGRSRFDPADRVRLRGVRVLVVDDEPTQLHALRHLLGDEGLVVSVATSGAEALDAVVEGCPDIALCDVGMRGMTGLELVARLRARHPAIIRVLMTGYSREHPNIAATLANHGCAYVAKPIDLGRLGATLVHQLDRRGGLLS